MKTQKGMTVIEVIILTIILAICLVLGTRVWTATQGNSNVTFSVNGLVESTCIEGYKFIVDQQGNARQILDEFGKGARCDAF